LIDCHAGAEQLIGEPMMPGYSSWPALNHGRLVNLGL
jgi:hypothetical protein